MINTLLSYTLTLPLLFYYTIASKFPHTFILSYIVLHITTQSGVDLWGQQQQQQHRNGGEMAHINSAGARLPRSLTMWPLAFAGLVSGCYKGTRK